MAAKGKPKADDELTEKEKELAEREDAVEKKEKELEAREEKLKAQGKLKPEEPPLTTDHDGGWFNGNPKLMIERGSYGKYREMITGYTGAQMEEFDALWEEKQAEASAKKSK